MKKIKLLIFALLLLTACQTKYDESAFVEDILEIIENDKLWENNEEKAVKRLAKLIGKHPESLMYDLEEFGDGTWPAGTPRWIQTVISDDSDIRVYTIMKSMGEYSVVVKEIAQYTVYEGDIFVKGVYTSVLDNIPGNYNVTGAWCTGYFGGINSYLLVSQPLYYELNGYYTECVTAYSFNEKTHELEESELFDTGKERLSKIDIDWKKSRKLDNGKVLYSENHHINLPRFDEFELLIPLITKDKIMTEGYLRYIMSDEHVFRYCGICPIVNFTADDYFEVVIDILPYGKYKYSSWSINKSLYEEPDITLLNGTMECWDEYGPCTPDMPVTGRKYTFKNKDYTYCFENGLFKGEYLSQLSVFYQDRLLHKMEAEIYYGFNMASY